MSTRLIDVSTEKPKGYKAHDCLVVKDTGTGQHYYLSDVGYECLAFRCDEAGNVTDWEEVAGRMHGGQSVAEVRAELETRLADGSSARTDNVTAAGGPAGMAVQMLSDIARNI